MVSDATINAGVDKATFQLYHKPEKCLLKKYNCFQIFCVVFINIGEKKKSGLK